MNWTEETINELWDIIKRKPENHEYRYTEFDEDNENLIRLIRSHEEG